MGGKELMQMPRPHLLSIFATSKLLLSNCNNLRREIGDEINRFEGRTKSFPFCLGLGLHLEMLQGTKLPALGYLAAGASPVLRDKAGQKGGTFSFH